MPQLADYKIIEGNSTTLANVGDTLSINFDLPTGALLLNGPKRPFITFSQSAAGAAPLTVEIALNGVLVNTQIYTFTLPGSAAGPQFTTRTVLINGPTFYAQSTNQQNTLVFTLTNTGIGVGGTVTLRDVIVHFQQVS